MGKNMLNLVLILSLLKQIQMQIISESAYRSKRNKFIDLELNQISLLDSFKVRRDLYCLAKCTQLDTCVSCVYTQDEINGLNCFLYNRRIIPTFSNGTMSLFNKLCPTGEMQSYHTKCYSLKAIFDNGLPPLQTIQYSVMSGPIDFYISPQIPHNYYINNYGGGTTMIIDRNWNLLSYFNIPFPRGTRKVNNFTYVLAQDGFRKFDYNMQLVTFVSFVSNTNPCNSYRLYFSDAYKMFYISKSCLNKIDLFDLNMQYLGNISLNQRVMAFTEFDGKIYVGTFNRTVFVIQNRSLIGYYTDICATTSEMRGLIIDYEGYMAVACTNDHSVFLYHINGTNINKAIVTPGDTYWAYFDLNGNLAVTDANLDKIYLYR